METIRIHKEASKDVIKEIIAEKEPATANAEIKKIKRDRTFSFEKISVLFFYALAFLLPIFALPVAVSPIVSSKAVLFYGCVVLATFFWLLARLQNGTLKIPKSILFLSLAGVVVVSLFSSLFSKNISASLLGKFYDLDTFSVIAFAALTSFLVSMLFQAEKRIFNFYLLTFVSGIFVFLFQFLHVFFGINLVPFNVFPSATSNLVGGWNDFSIFFGFIGLVSLIFFEFSKFGKGMKTFLLSMTIISLLGMLAVNFFANWVIFGLFALVIFIYIFSKLFFQVQNEGAISKAFLRTSLFVVLAVVVFVLGRNMIGEKMNSYLNTGFIEVRPSWGATMDIAKQTLKSDPILGSGPNTFAYNWMKFKSPSINSTVFWNTRFSSGVGLAPSMLATTGILGGVALLSFFIFFIYYGKRIINSDQDNLLNLLTTASFFGAAYLWAFSIFYTPGLVIFVMAFIVTGMMVALMVKTGKMGLIELSFLNKEKTGFASILAIVFLLIGSIVFSYFYSQRYLALYNFNKVLVSFNASGDADKAEQELLKVIGLDKQDEYYRALSEVELVKLNQVLNNTGIPKDSVVNIFTNTLGAAIESASNAIKLNSADPLNWMQLGRIYESVVPLKIAGSDKNAIETYLKTLEISPLDPTPLLAAARISAQTEKIKEAREYISRALNLKPDFSSALFLLSKIEVQEGNLKEAILRSEQVATLAPNDIGVLFQLGLLYYQANNLEGAKAVFERIVSLNNDYANARYFLGLVYDRQGVKNKAIEQFEIIQKTNPDNGEVKKIINNIRSGRSALSNISPAPEQREDAPISEDAEMAKAESTTKRSSKKK